MGSRFRTRRALNPSGVQQTSHLFRADWTSHNCSIFSSAPSVRAARTPEGSTVSWTPQSYQIGDPLDANINWEAVTRAAIERTKSHEIRDTAPALARREPVPVQPLRPEEWHGWSLQNRTRTRSIGLRRPAAPAPAPDSDPAPAPSARFWWDWSPGPTTTENV